MQSQSWACSPAEDICLHPHYTDSFKRPWRGFLPTLWAGDTTVGSLLESRLLINLLPEGSVTLIKSSLGLNPCLPAVWGK